MKKLFGFLMVAVITVCLTGCGSNSSKLICTGEMDGDKATAKVTLKDDKVTKVIIENITKLPAAGDAAFLASLIDAKIDATEEVEGLKMSAKANGTKVTAIATMDIVKMSAEDIEDLFGTTDLTKDAFVKYIEDKGLTCK